MTDTKLEPERTTATSRRIEPFVASVWPWVHELEERNPEAVFFGGGIPPTDVIPVERLRHVRFFWRCASPLRRWLVQ